MTEVHRHSRWCSNEDRFASYVVKHVHHPGCWEWIGARDRDGYGKFQADMTLHKAHAWAYERAKGPVPDGFEIDHLCARMPGGLGPPCVNHDHMEARAPKENVLRSNGLGARNARKTHCKRGHEFTPENTYTATKNKNGGPRRPCKACNKIHAETSKRKNSGVSS